MAFIRMLMELFIWEVERMISRREKERKHGRMALVTKVIILMGRRVVKECLNGRMGVNTLVSFITIISMEKENIYGMIKGLMMVNEMIIKWMGR